MVIKKSVFVHFLLLLIMSAGALHAQWRSDVAQLFSKGKDYKAISEYLLQNYNKLENVIDNADASGILAFCFGRLNDPQNETRWITEYFESCGAKDTGFAFLDLVNQVDVIGWLNTWKSRYPFIIEIALIKGIGDEPLVPQGILPLVVDIMNDAYYKFYLGSNVLEGGQFKSGFNIIALDANELFLNPGKRVCLLEVKSGGLVLKKEITLDVEASFPRMPAGQPSPQSIPPVHYALSMYVGGELVLSSRKTESVAPPFQLGLKPSNNPAYLKPDYYVKRNDPWANPNFNSFSIFDAVGILYKVLKDLLKKKDNKDAQPPKIQTVQDLSLVFRPKDSAGRDREIKVSIKLRTKNLPYVLSLP